MAKQYLDSYAEITVKSNNDFYEFYKEIDKEIERRGGGQEALRQLSVGILQNLLQTNPDQIGIVEQYFRGYANVKDWQIDKQVYHFEKPLYDAIMDMDASSFKNEMIHMPVDTVFLDLHDASDEILGIFVECNTPSEILQSLTFYKNGYVIAGTWNEESTLDEILLSTMTDKPAQLGLRAAILLAAYLSQKEPDVTYHKDTTVSRKKVGKKTKSIVLPGYFEVGKDNDPVAELKAEVEAAGVDYDTLVWVAEGKTSKSQKPHIKRAKFEGRRVNAKDENGKDIVLEDGTKKKTIAPNFVPAKAVKLPE